MNTEFYLAISKYIENLNKNGDFTTEQQDNIRRSLVISMQMLSTILEKEEKQINLENACVLLLTYFSASGKTKEEAEKTLFGIVEITREILNLCYEKNTLNPLEDIIKITKTMKGKWKF